MTLGRAAGPDSPGWAKALLLAVAVASLGWVFQQTPLPQNQAYHQFADTRTLAGVPHFGDVITNLAFLIPGLIGLFWSLHHQRTGAVWSWRALFAGSALVGLGSSYYHWRPENWTLLWDRLPMTISFMGLFSILLCESVWPEAAERVILPPLVLAGIVTVVYWYLADDLRFYLWVQFFPLACMVVIPLLFPPRFTHRWYLFVALGLYVLAKVTEISDRPIYLLTGEFLSGHSIKHLLAGLAAVVLFLQVSRRRAVGPPSSGCPCSGIARNEGIS